MSTIDEIKSKIDIVGLVSEAGVKLRHAGKITRASARSMTTNIRPRSSSGPETGTWRCFGQCNEGGDIFKFVMKREGLDFKEALQKLATRAGVELKEYQRETPQQKEAYENAASCWKMRSFIIAVTCSPTRTFSIICVKRVD
ncbi:MAG: CHC2 zinc finger domain-containing protein [Anaerolineales bacterium]